MNLESALQKLREIIRLKHAEALSVRSPLDLPCS
jgi:hypothetical protein